MYVRAIPTGMQRRLGARIGSEENVYCYRKTKREREREREREKKREREVIDSLIWKGESMTGVCVCVCV